MPKIDNGRYLDQNCSQMNGSTCKFICNQMFVPSKIFSRIGKTQITCINGTWEPTPRCVCSFIFS